MKIIEFIKKRKLILILVLVLTAWIANSILSRIPERPQGPGEPGVSYRNLVPGVSSRSDVIEKMGNPVDQAAKGEEILLSFKSTSPTRTHEAIVDSGNTLSFIKEIVSVNDDKHIADITSQHGEAPHPLYGPHSINGFDLFVYPDKGLAYIGNPYGTQGTILEIWYFPPTTIENFKSTWAPGYSNTYQPSQ